MKQCPVCWIEFEWKRKYCSDKCRIKNDNQKRYNKLIEKKCAYCWNSFMWRANCKYCSSECRTKGLSENVSKTQKTKASRDKYKATCMEKYWVDNISKLQAIKDKKAQTTREHWWVDYSFQSKELMNKAKQTIKNKFWVEYPAQSELVLEKMQESCMKKFWVRNASQSDIIKLKKEQTCLTNYWVPHACLTEQCKNASSSNSNINKEFRSWLRDNWIDCPEKEHILECYSYDAIVWNTLIEINPSISHTSTPWIVYKEKSKYYHKDKTEMANKHWFDCIHIFDWDDRNKILNMLKEKKKIWARQCSIVELSYSVAHEFFQLFHLQWDTRHIKSNVYIWLQYGNELVMVMSFWKARYNKNYEREILRLCSDWDYIVVWGANKIFTYFIDKYNPSSIISYCDLSKFSWWVYEQLWMTQLWKPYPRRHRRYKWLSWKDKKAIESTTWIKIVKPPKEAWHFTDVEIMYKRWFDQLVWKYFWEFGKWTKNDELMKMVWYIEVYDCWQATYVWEKEKEEK